MKRLKNKFYVAIILSSIIGPIVIHLSYKSYGPLWLESEWSAGDALSYFGVILASIITIYGLHLTFQDNSKGINEQGRLDKVPFLTINVLSVEYRVPWLEDKVIAVESQAFINNEDDYYFKEKKFDSVFFVINNGSVNAKNHFSKEELDRIKRQGRVWKSIAKGTFSLVDTRVLYIPIEITNYGNGVAVDLRIGLNKSDVLDEKKKYIRPLSIGVEESIYIGIYSEISSINNDGTYNLELIYQDIFENNYKQINQLEISMNSEDQNATFDCSSKQIRINKT